MKVGDAKAETGRGLKAPGGSVHADGGWSEGVFRGKEEGSPVLAIFIGGFRGAGEDVVPSRSEQY